MAIKIFVTATNTDVGKTHTTLLLMEQMAAMGLKPAAFKPIETGVKEIPPDGAALLEATRRLNPSATSLRLEEVVPYTFALPAAPFVAKGDRTVEIEKLIGGIERLERLCDVLLIEGAGGPMVPVEKGLFMIDFPRLFGAKTLLVAPGRLGSINDTLLCEEALKRRDIAPYVAVNLKEEDKTAFWRVTNPYYEAVGKNYYLLPDDTARLANALVHRNTP